MDSKTPKYDAKVKEILDALEPGEQTCKLTGEKWDMDQEEIDWFKKFNVPPAKVHPVNRVKITTAFATGFGWWWQKHPETGDPLLTYVHPATGVKALPDPEFHEKDPTDKARDYKPEENFFEQIREMQLEIPIAAWRSLEKPVNSIALLSQGDENSYFVTACRSKNTMYSYDAEDVEDSAEVYNSQFVAKSYSVLNSQRIHNCQVVRQSFDCIDSAFVFDCRNCEHCFGATNKRNKKYLWFNEQLTREEWEKRRAEVDLASRQVFKKHLKQFQDLMISDKTVWPANFNEQTENCIGEYLNKSRDCKYIFAGFDSNNNYHGVMFLGKNEGNAFLGGAIESTDNYYSHAPLVSSRCKFVHSCYRCQDLEYCMQCYNCENCFGCVGLIRKKFCVFNKQYTEEEYWLAVDEIKCNLLDRDEYGDFFPLSYSPCYVLASPSLVFLLDEKEVEKLGGMIYDPDSCGALGDAAQNAEMKSIQDIPDHIKDLDPEVWSKVAVDDPEEKRKFAFIKPEITLYQKLGVAPADHHPMARLRNLVFEANSALFVEDKCRNCEAEIITSKNKNYPERNIYCNKCYLEYLEQYG